MKRYASFASDSSSISPSGASVSHPDTGETFVKASWKIVTNKNQTLENRVNCSSRLRGTSVTARKRLLCTVLLGSSVRPVPRRRMCRILSSICAIYLAEERSSTGGELAKVGWRRICAFLRRFKRFECRYVEISVLCGIHCISLPTNSLLLD